jgi:hypothetical protein
MTDSRSEATWRRVGLLSVDSGICLIADPMYHRDGIYGVAEAEAAAMATITSSTQAAPLLARDGQELGVAVATGYGDDLYPVEVRYVTDQRGTLRVAELRVRFIDE